MRALVAHLVAQCQDSIHLASMVRRELLRRRRYPDKTPLDAYMAVGVDHHRAASGPQLVERFARLWPRAARARRRPAVRRRIKLDPGIPGQPRWRLDYLLDIIYNRDLWLHRVDLAGRPGGRSSWVTTTARSSPRSSETSHSPGRRRRWRWS